MPGGRRYQVILACEHRDVPPPWVLSLTYGSVEGMSGDIPLSNFTFPLPLFGVPSRFAAMQPSSHRMPSLTAVLRLSLRGAFAKGFLFFSPSSRAHPAA